VFTWPYYPELVTRSWQRQEINYPGQTAGTKHPSQAQLYNISWQYLKNTSCFIGLSHSLWLVPQAACERISCYLFSHNSWCSV